MTLDTVQWTHTLDTNTGHIHWTQTLDTYTGHSRRDSSMTDGNESALLIFVHLDLKM